MQSKPYPTIMFYPGGPSLVRFELRLTDRYVLSGDYIHGELKGVTLHKQSGAHAETRQKER